MVRTESTETEGKRRRKREIIGSEWLQTERDRTEARKKITCKVPDIGEEAVGWRTRVCKTHTWMSLKARECALGGNLFATELTRVLSASLQIRSSTSHSCYIHSRHSPVRYVCKSLRFEHTI